MDMAKINETLKRLRLDRGMTQEEVAEQVGLTRQAVSSYESGRTQPGLDILERLAQVYEVELTDIVYGRSKSAKIQKALNITAMVAAAVVLAAQLLASLLLWTANRFFPIEPGIQFDTQTAVWEVRVKLSEAYGVMEGLYLSLVPLFCVALLVLTLCLRRSLGAKVKVLSVLGYAAASMVVVLPWAMTDPVFPAINYLIGPQVALGDLLLFFLLSQVIDFFRGRKGRKAKTESVE